MTPDPLHIFVVDDDPASREVAAEVLADSGHRIRQLAGGAELIAATGEPMDIVLLDVTMPGIDGIKACRALRQAGQDQAQIIFISGHDDLETRLAAYQAGGNDFLVKPCPPQELAEKVRLAERSLLRHRELSSQAHSAQQAAFTAMSSMGEMGIVLQFMRDSFACHDPSRLGATLLEALGQYGLAGLAEIRFAGGRLRFSSRGECTPLEESILGHAQGAGRIFQLSSRMAVNYPRVTLLVLDLPVADAERAGRLRDHLAILAEGAEARVEAMESELQRMVQAAGISHAVAELSQTLTDIERSQARNRLRAMEIDARYLEDLVEAFVHLGLSEDQESHLADMAQHTHVELNTLRDEDHSASDRLRQVASSLTNLIVHRRQATESRGQDIPLFLQRTGAGAAAAAPVWSTEAGDVLWACSATDGAEPGARPGDP